MIAESIISSYNYKFGSFLLGTHLGFRSSIIASKFLIVQHAALKCILEQKYDKFVNVTIYDKFISPYFLWRYSQYSKNNWIRRQNLQNKNKEDEQKQETGKTTATNCRGNKGTSFIRGGQTTSKKVLESALKKSFKKQKKRG